MVTNWKKILVKCLVNYWKITGKRLETEQNGLIDFDISGAYFYLGALKPPGFRKIRDFQPENDLSPGISLDYRRRLSQTATGTPAGNPWAGLCGVCLSASGRDRAEDSQQALQVLIQGILYPVKIFYRVAEN